MTKLKLQDLNPEDLDDLVTDIAMELASNANNGGISGQMDFLIQIGGKSEEDILKYVEEQREILKYSENWLEANGADA
jgi:hypothetical protein